MRRIMFMMNSLYGGGAERILQNIISHLDRNKYEVTLYSMHREKIDADLYKGDFTYRVVFDEYQGNSAIGKRIYQIYSKIRGKLFLMLSSKLFYPLFIRGKYDVEVAFIEGESTKIISGSNQKSKKIAWIHCDLIQNPWTEFLYRGREDERNHYNQFNKVLCVSDSVRNAVITKFGFESCRVATQYNPIDGCAIRRMSQEKCTLPLKKRLRMIAVGRLVAQKGFDRLLRIVSILKRDGFNFELYILGEGEDREKLESYIVHNGLKDRVFLLGFQENPYPFMRVSDLLVCSSRAEGFSTVVSEGVVLGLPVVSTDCAGVREIFGDESCGIITENTEEALYKALYDVLSSPDCLGNFAQAAAKRGEAFSLKKNMEELEILFDE